MMQIKKKIFLFGIIFGLFFCPLKTNAAEEIIISDVADQKSVIDEQAEVLYTAGVASILERKQQELEMEVVNFEKGYTTYEVKIHIEPKTESEVLDSYSANQEIYYIFENENWVKVLYNNSYGYIYKSYISGEENCKKRLNQRDGICYGPNGKETYYNLNMKNVIKYMNDLGYSYEFWIREDGVKMFGDFVMIAADLHNYSKGDLVEISLGIGIVCDTGDFASNGSDVAFDVATNW